MVQIHPRSPAETMPTMYDLPSEDPYRVHIIWRKLD